MGNTSYRFPTYTFSNGLWHNASNVKAADSNYAGIGPSGDAGGYTPPFAGVLTASGYALGLPADATIVNGIEVTLVGVYVNAGGASLRYPDSLEVILTKGDGSPKKEFAKINAISGTPADYIFGGSTDLWNDTWLTTDFNNCGFGTLIRVGQSQIQIDNYEIRVDAVKVRVFHNGVETSGGTACGSSSGGTDDGVVKLGAGSAHIFNTSNGGGTNYSDSFEWHDGESLDPAGNEAWDLCDDTHFYFRKSQLIKIGDRRYGEPFAPEKNPGDFY